MCLVGILGNGEIGSSLRQVYGMAGFDDVTVRDPFQGLDASLSECDLVNVCIPFSGFESFARAIKDLELRRGCVVVIHSTVRVGCTDRLQDEMPDAVFAHSPVRGVHPELTQGLLAFDKYVGMSDRFFRDGAVTDRLTSHIVSLKMKPFVCRAKESELAKIVSTTLYGISIAAITDVADLCENNGVDFGVVFTKWQTGYNSGYTALGKPGVCRPVLTPVPRREDGSRVIGGHCVLPNCAILRDELGERTLSQFVLRYSDEEGLTHASRGQAAGESAAENM